MIFRWERKKILDIGKEQKADTCSMALDEERARKKKEWMNENKHRVFVYRRAHCLKQCYDRVSFPCRASLVKYEFTTNEMLHLLFYIHKQLQSTSTDDKNTLTALMPKCLGRPYK